MKRILICGLTLIAAASISSVVFAADKPPNILAVNGQIGMLWSRLAENNGENPYIVTIPGKITIINSETSAPFAVEASNVLIAPDKRLTVRMASCNDFILKTGRSSIPYVCRFGENKIDENTVILSVNGAGKKNASSGLNNDLTLSASAETTYKAAKFGTHTDTITFRCAVENIEE